MCFVDLVGISFISCMVIDVEGIWKYVVMSWRHGIAMISEGIPG